MVDLLFNDLIMRKTVPGSALLVSLLMACNDKQQTLSDSAMHAKVDSIVGVRMIDLNRQSMEDLDHRIAIEVKAKADSIVAARIQPKDTTAKKPEPMKVRVQKPNLPNQ